MSSLTWIILSTVVISLLALVGVVVLYIKEKLLDRILFYLVAYAAGALLGGAFFHLLPEAVEESGCFTPFLYTIVGFCLFFILEKFLYWRHCHKRGCPIHMFTYLNLIGDSLHNFIDGLVIAVTFLASIPLGISTAIAIALHEIPQEIGDFGVLVYGGFSRRKALLLNFLVAITVIIGGIVGYLISNQVAGSLSFLLPFTAGGFIYIASADLLPELRKETNLSRSISNFLVFLLGLLTLYLVRYI